MSSLVTVIMPVYGVEDHLENGVQSVLKQTCRDIRLILVDDGSPDRCGEICDALAEKDSRITVIHKENGGVSSARNAGLDIAESQWIYFMDPDDAIEPETIAAAVNSAEEKGADVCFFDYELVYRNKKIPLRSLSTEKELLKADSAESLFVFCHTCNIWTALIRSECIKNKIRFDTELFMFEDAAFRFALFSQVSSFAYVKKVFHHHTMIEGSATHKVHRSIWDCLLRMKTLMTEYISLFKYPENADIVPNDLLLLNCGMVMLSLFSDPSAKLKEKLDRIYRILSSDHVRSAAGNCRKEDLGELGRLIVLLSPVNKVSSAFIALLFKLRCDLNNLTNKKHY